MSPYPRDPRGTRRHLERRGRGAQSAPEGGAAGRSAGSAVPGRGTGCRRFPVRRCPAGPNRRRRRAHPCGARGCSGRRGGAHTRGGGPCALGTLAEARGRLRPGASRAPACALRTALDGVLVDAVARAARIPTATVCRDMMMAGDLGPVAAAARAGGEAALAPFGLQLMQPVALRAAPAAARGRHGTWRTAHRRGSRHRRAASCSRRSRTACATRTTPWWRWNWRIEKAALRPTPYAVRPGHRDDPAHHSERDPEGLVVAVGPGVRLGGTGGDAAREGCDASAIPWRDSLPAFLHR